MRPARPRTNGVHSCPRTPNNPATPSCVLPSRTNPFSRSCDWSLRQCVADLESLHHFVLAKLVLQKFLELVKRELCRTLLQLDECFRRLAAIFISDADHGYLLDARVLVDRLLKYARINIEAAAQQHVLGAIDDVDVAILVHVADLAGPHEAVGGHDLGSGIRIFPVPLHYVRAPDAQFT